MGRIRKQLPDKVVAADVVVAPAVRPEKDVPSGALVVVAAGAPNPNPDEVAVVVAAAGVDVVAGAPPKEKPEAGAAAEAAGVVVVAAGKPNPPKPVDAGAVALGGGADSPKLSRRKNNENFYHNHCSGTFSSLNSGCSYRSPHPGKIGV
jgi:hypothetical protein